MDKIRLAIIGAGNRGMEVYGGLALQYSQDVVVTAVVEPDDFKRGECAKRHSITPERSFRTIGEFFSAGKMADAVIVANPDRAHNETIKAALGAGYHLLLEKPISTSVEQIKEISEIAAEYPDRIIIVCHVLRYSPFFGEIKRILDSGLIGGLVSIEHNEHIGYYHYAHSYVRGNWSRVETSSPLILAKSCHDMDILRWLAGSRCVAISAFGGLSYFKPSSAPANAAERCADCLLRHECPFSACRIYTDPTTWPGLVVAPSKTDEELKRRIAQGPYGRCVYHCDNDMIDHLSSSIAFENGITASFSISAFTADITRTVRLMGTKGELRGDMLGNEIEITVFGKKKTRIVPDVVKGGHGGGDLKLFEEFIDCLRAGRNNSLTPLSVSLESHLMALAAEKSRMTGQMIRLTDL
jgi:predicted dehydrogenase